MGLANLMNKTFSGSMKWVLIVAFVLLCVFLLDYSRKYNTFDNMENENTDSKEEDDDTPLSEPAHSIGHANGNSSANPSDLLPASNSGENGWDVLNSVGTTAGANPELLEAGHHTGIDSVGQSLRNANLQLRSDPVILLKDTGPWNQSTIEATNMQVPFNLGR